MEYKKGWNPDTTLKTICAFANDIDNWSGGYIVIGAEEIGGVVSGKIEGVNIKEIDKIQKEILNYCKMIMPVYLPVVQPVVYKGSHLIMIWCPGGYDRPYQCPKIVTSKNKEYRYYIRKTSSTIEAKGADLNELYTHANNVPFDDRVNVKSKITDLKYPLINNYLSEVNSELMNKEGYGLGELATDLRIAGGPPEYFKPINVGLMFFSENPEMFFSECRIEIVRIPEPTGEGMEEVIIRGPIDQQLRDALRYIRNNVISEKVFKVPNQAEAIRVRNYSYEAIEEVLSNAVYHKSYQIASQL